MASILIIDDDDTIRSVIAQAMEVAGHSVREASNGNEGLQLYRAAPADLVLTDIVMPDKEGLATIMELRRDFPRARIIAMSGGFAHNSRVYLHMAERFGAVRVLRKPLRLAELETMIAEVLAGAPPGAPSA